MSGRRRKPTALKRLQNNPGGRPLNNNEPKFSGIPKCPAWLSKVAKAEFKRVFTELEALDMLTSVDTAALVGYAQSYADYREAIELVQKHGLLLTETVFARDTGKAVGTKYKRNPASVAANTALRNMAKFGSMFGFDPSSRTKLSLTPPADESAELDAFLDGDNEED